MTNRLTRTALCLAIGTFLCANAAIAHAATQAKQAASVALVNLALNRPARQSSTDFGGLASRAVDGRTDGNWHNNSVSHTGIEQWPWWEVDLQQSSFINRVSLFNRTDCCRERLNSASIVIYDANRREVARRSIGAAQTAMPINFGVNGRYVRVQLPRRDYLSLAEVRVIGPQSGGSAPQGVVGPNASGITWNFETGDLRGWTTTGTAFAHQPTQGDNPTARRRGQPSSHRGNYWVGTYENYQGRRGERPGSTQGDAPTGTMTSRAFTIPGGNLSFLVGGGASNQNRVVLLVGNRPVLSASGRNTETMHEVTWDLSPWRGRRGQIRIVDHDSGGWGHINADDFRFHRSGPVNPNLVNLALNRPTRQSSTWTTGSASRAVDGRTDGNWYNNSVSHTRLEHSPWWEVDLQQNSLIARVSLFNRTDCCSERLNGAIVVIYDANRREVARRSIAAAQTAIPINFGVSGRYVRVQLPRRDYLSLAEVRVIGRRP